MTMTINISRAQASAIKREQHALKKPTRRDLLKVIERCQNLFGSLSAAGSDRNPNRAADLARLTSEGFELCVSARAGDPP